MNIRLIRFSIAWSSMLAGSALGQSGPAPAVHVPQYSTQGTAVAAQGTAVSYASVTQLNGLLAQLGVLAKTAQADLAKLRIEKWKTDVTTKQQSLGDAESIQRNLRSALPEMLERLRDAPEDMPATFELYRNLDAFYDVLSSLVESAGAFGPKDDFQTLSNDWNALETIRKQLAERMGNLAAAKEQEILRLRADLKSAQAAMAATPPKKIIVDDSETAKKPVVKKKTVASKAAASKPASAPAAAASGQAAPSNPQ